MTDRTVSRRRFMSATGAGLAALGVGCGDGSEGSGAGGSDGEGGTSSEGGSGGLVGMADIVTGSGVPVAVVAVESPDAAVERAIELSGGLDELRDGHTVFVKPNAVHGRAPDSTGIVTSNAVLQAVVRRVKAQASVRVIVGDRSSRTNSVDTFDRMGIRQAALDAGADEVLEARPPSEAPDQWMLMQPPLYEETWSAQGGVLALRAIVEADHVVNVPACKDHEWAVFTLSLKNFIGGIGDDSRDPLHYALDPARLGRDIALLNQLFSPLVNVVDATTAIVNGGPSGTSNATVRTTPGLVLASRDRVAVDATGVALLQHELSRTTVAEPDRAQQYLTDASPWALPQLANAVELGLGVTGPDEIQLRFVGVPRSEAQPIDDRMRRG